MSDRMSSLPPLPDTTIRQIVVRLTTKQTLRKHKKEAHYAGPPPKIMDCTEHIVLQQMRVAGKEKEWRIWGHTTPTTVDDLRDPQFAPGLSLQDRLMAMKDMFGM